jgi:hypothetical protein
MGFKHKVAVFFFQKWRSAVVIKDIVAVRVLHVTINCGYEGYSGGCCFTNGNQLWGLRIQWRLLFFRNGDQLW